MNIKQLQWIVGCLIVVTSGSLWGMGLRSFAALPLEEKGIVFRLVDNESLDDNRNTLVTEFAYGLSGAQTLLFGIPYRLSPSGKHRTGDVSLLYRHMVWQQNFKAGTHRLALLGGGLIPTNKTSDGGAQVGFVATFYRNRHELDLDGLWMPGFGQSRNQALFDVSWQYRLWPLVYPATGLGSELNSVLEYNGRQQEGEHLIHQTTLGLQWIHPTWVLEGGLVKDINAPYETQLIVSVRFHI